MSHFPCLQTAKKKKKRRRKKKLQFLEAFKTADWKIIKIQSGSDTLFNLFYGIVNIYTFAPTFHELK